MRPKKPTNDIRRLPSRELEKKVAEKWRLAVAKRRMEACISRRELAKATGLSYRLIAYFEDGSTSPKAFQLRVIADALNVRVDDLFERTTEPPVTTQELYRHGMVHKKLWFEKRKLRDNRRTIARQAEALIRYAHTHLNKFDPDLQNFINKIVLKKKNNGKWKSVKVSLTSNRN